MNATFKTAVLAVLLLATATSAHAFSFDDVQYWVGSGANRALLVIDFNNGAARQSLAWGYRWNGSATGLDMLRAVAGAGFIRQPEGGSVLGPVTGADPRLFLRLSSWTGADAGTTVFGVGYDVNSNASAFLPGYEEIPGSGEDDPEIGHASDPADFYREGWVGPHWGYSVLQGSTWATIPIGASLRNLSDGHQDAWIFNPGTNYTPHTPVPAAPPIPSDANRDLAVDLLDFGLLKDHFGITAGASWAVGDFNADGVVDLQDFGLLKDHFGQSSFLTAVPEPASLALTLLAAALARPRRSRTR